MAEPESEQRYWVEPDRERLFCDSESPSPPDVLAQEIVDNMETALEQFAAIAGKLKK